MFLYFDILTWFQTLNFGAFYIILFIKINIYARIYIRRLHFDYAVIYIVIFINYIRKFVNITIFRYWANIFRDFVLSVLINLLTTTDIHYVLNTYIHHDLVTKIVLNYCKIHCHYSPSIFCLVCDLIHLKLFKNH